MKDKTRLAITGVVAAGALALTVGGHGLNFTFGDDEGGGGDDSGPQVTRTLETLKGFDGVTLTSPDDVVVTRGKNFLVEAEGAKGVVDRLNLFVKDGTLHIERKKDAGWRGRGDATVRVTLPALQRVTLTGPGDMRVDRLDGKQVRAEITGPGNLAIGALEAEKAELALTGPGDLSVSGKAKMASLSTTGPGDIIARDLATERAELELIGTGDISVRASQSADISIIGTGDARVTGTTACRITKTGPGDARCTD
jgi:hypothetical protein